MQGTKELKASTAASPDLDWSQVSETVRMLNLAVAQISMATHEGEDSVQSLTASFLAMVENVEDIASAARELGPGEDHAAVQSTVLQRCAAVQSGIQQSIVAFQFYDRLHQRLDHVRFALDQLAQLVADKSRLFDPQQWQDLQHGIRSQYSMQEEQEMFEALLNGASVDEALQLVRKKMQEGKFDDIELF